jgi:Concanavalin A-like lectin/glucanases superfamily
MTMRRTLVASFLATAVCVLLATTTAFAQVTPSASYVEIDGDYGSIIADTNPGTGGNDQAADEVIDGGFATYARRSTPLCSQWSHEASAPYMGSQAYTVSCPAADSVRSEQMLVKQWYGGADSARSLMFAFRLRDVPSLPVSDIGGFVAQLHQGSEGPPPFRLKWGATAGGGYYIQGGAKYDRKRADGTIATRQPTFFEAAIVPNVWYRIMVQLDPGPAIGSGECPQGPGNSGRAIVWIMHNATGIWGPPSTYTGQLGYRYSQPTGTCHEGSALSYQWKVGQYVVSHANTLDYDNVAYGKRWNNITKNRLIGYHKSVLRLAFEELSSSVVDDRSWSWNGGTAGDPTKDYGNDGVIVGGVQRISNGMNGRALQFDGTNYVKVPIDLNDFDVGNYLTVSAWFRTTALPTENRGLVMMDEFSNTWKLLLYASRNSISFGVRHPSGVYSRLDHFVPVGRYADNQWHLVTGTFNRFTPDGRRIKLYVDGIKVLENVGNNLPVLRGDDRLTVGKFSVGGYFQGDIDDVGLFNYAMTAKEVNILWIRRGAP